MVAATLRPENRYGSEAGSRIFQKVWPAAAPIVEDSWSISGSIDFRPVTIEMTTGKNAINTATTIFGVSPNPSHTTKRGAMAIFGMTWATSSRGYSVLSTAGE